MQYYATIEPHLKEWALQQAVFFVASAPLTGRHVNLSPKGLPASSFSILNANLCGYVDATGSGNETVSHVLENGRVTVMFCSFETSPRILRLFCTGRVIELGEPGFDGWLKRMGDKHVIGARALILLDVFKVSQLFAIQLPPTCSPPPGCENSIQPESAASLFSLSLSAFASAQTPHPSIVRFPQGPFTTLPPTQPLLLTRSTNLLGPNILRLRSPLPGHPPRPRGPKQTPSLPARPQHAGPLGRQEGGQGRANRLPRRQQLRVARWAARSASRAQR